MTKMSQSTDAYKLQIAMMYSKYLKRQPELSLNLENCVFRQSKIGFNVLNVQVLCVVLVCVCARWFFPSLFRVLLLFSFYFRFKYFVCSFAIWSQCAICSTLAVLLFCRSLFFMCNLTRCVKCMFDRSGKREWERENNKCGVLARKSTKLRCICFVLPRLLVQFNAYQRQPKLEHHIKY